MEGRCFETQRREREGTKIIKREVQVQLQKTHPILSLYFCISHLFLLNLCVFSTASSVREEEERELKERMFHPKKPSTMNSNERSSMCVQNDSGLVLTTDPKPRLRWTVELHERFVDAVTQLGGPDSMLSCYICLFKSISLFMCSSKSCASVSLLICSCNAYYACHDVKNKTIIYISAEATPKTIMRVMGVKGLTLYHLKSHLQV